MWTICWVFVYGVFVAAATNITTPELENSPDTADLALETVLGFNSTENAENINFLDKVQKVIGNIKSAFERKSSNRRTLNIEKVGKFTDFIQNLIKKLQKFDDKNLKSFITVFNEEIRKYHYRGCKFHELIENYSLRRHLSSMLNDIQLQPAVMIRDKLKEFANKLEKEKYNKYEENLIETINSVYRKDSVKQFKYFLIDLDSYRLKGGKMNTNIAEIIKGGLRLIIFDHYSQLNQNARMELKFQVNEFWKYLSKSLSSVSANSGKSKSNNDTINRDTNTDSKQSLQPSDSRKSLKQDENKFNKPRNESTSNDPVIAPNEKIDYSKKNKMNGRKRAQIMTTRRLLTKTKKLTFKTLYPKLAPEWTLDHSLFGEGQVARRSNVRWEKEKDAILKPVGAKRKRLDEKLGTTVKVRNKSSHVLKKTKKYNKSKKEAPIKKRRFNRRKANRRVMYHKASRHKHPNKFNRRNLSYKRMIDLSSESGDTRDSIVSDEGLAIEGSREVKANISQRRTDTDLNVTVESTVIELNSSLQTKVTVISPKVVNTSINNVNKINIETKNDMSNDKDKLEEDQKYKKDFKVDNTEKVPKIQEDKKLDNLKASSSTLKVNTPTTYISDVDKLLNVTERVHVHKNSASQQTTGDGGASFNFRAMAFSNETDTVTESAKTKEINLKNDVTLKKNSNAINLKEKLDGTQAGQNELSKTQDKIEPKKSMDKRNLKTDNDFKSFILDYENDLNEFKKSEATKYNREMSSTVTETNTKTETNAPTPISTTTTAPVTENPISRLSTIINVGPQNALNNINLPISINENRYLQSTTSIPFAFDAKFLKELMKTTKKPTTTRITKIMGRLINKDGIVFDSMEEVKQELYDTAINNMEYDYEKGKGSAAENN